MQFYKNITSTILILIAIPIFISAQNIALNKIYTLSALPNYQYSAPPSDKTSLTDGIYTKGYFWSQPTTVGWMGTSVSVDIDLGTIQPVGEVAFNTVRSTDAGVSFPKNIYVFISNDNKKFKYVGDAADTSDNSPGPYEIKKFILKDINTTTRYIIFSVVPNGKLLFCDEIEVLKGDPGNTLATAMLISKDSLKEAIDSLKNMDFNQKFLKQSVSKLLGISSERGNAKQYSDISAQLQRKNISKYDLRSYEKKVGNLHASNLKSKYDESFILEKYNPWDTLSQLHEPKGNAKNLAYLLTVLSGAVQYGCFVFTNTNSTSQKLVFKVSNGNPSISNIELFEVPYVPSLNYTRIPDPLIAVSNDISIDPGISQMFIFRITGVESGSTKSIISVQSGGVNWNININTQVKHIVSKQPLSNINANVWAYLNYPMLEDRKEQAAENLNLHHINTIVIPPAILPNMGTSEYATFINYLKNFKDCKNILLFMNYSSAILRNGYKNGNFMDSEWKSKFIEWYNNIVKLIQQNGFLNAQIYLYPYDEISGNNVKDFESLMNWSRKAIPGIKFYATLANQAAIDIILPLVDVAQIQSTYKGLINLPSHTCEIWIYSGSGPSRALSSYGFYRLMAWKAFANDYRGIGFWNYADEGFNKKLNLITDPLTTPTNSYSVIYNGPGHQIISTRRWEAFKLGIEDYALLKNYAEKVGFQKAKAFAEEVLGNPSDLNKADSVRNEILSLLFSK